MMLGLQGNASPSKEYRCVACSATFTGLASLLVHQATHAGTLSKLPNPAQKQPDTKLLETSCPTMSHLPESPSSSFYICDCGEEFKDFVLMMEHRQSHVSELQSPQPLDNNDLTSDRGVADLSNTQCKSLSADQTDILGASSTSKPSVGELSTYTNITGEVNEEHSAVTSTQAMGISPKGDADKQLERTLAAEELLSEEREVNESFESVPKNESLMKILASAYGKCYLSPQSTNNNKNMVTPKEEPIPIVIAPQPKIQPSSVTDTSVLQLRRLLGKPGMKTKAPSISRLLECSTKKIVSLTKIFSPVVVLETRQRFIDTDSNGTYGKYQCARCRRVFQNLGGLTEHHFLHKKERIKCCRRCKQLIIGRIPFPDNHICPQLGGKTTVYSSSFRKNAPTGQKTVQFHSVNNRRKVYFCPICKHNYARRYNLKVHKCRGPVSAHSHQVKPLNNTAETDLNGQDENNTFQSIAVGTQVRSCIKEEETSPESETETAFSHLAWASPSIKEPHKNGFTFGTSFLQGQDSSWVSMSDKDDDGHEGQWTMPLDDEMEIHPSAEKDSSVEDTGKSLSVSQFDVKTTTQHYFVKDGVRRYPCNKCQQTYSSPCTLRRHQRLCGFKARGIRIAQSSSAISLNANSVKMFACYVCGRNFNRKDNMMAHRKKCELRRTMNPNAVSENNQSLPSNAAECQTQEDDGGSWGIMSLPSVLPRRVTCECGIGFTSPRLLLEHLQKHAQESYTCPTCGVTVNSWADYEIHLQIHMHPLHQKQSQPLLLRFKQPTVQQQPSQSAPKLPEKLVPFQEQLPNQRKKQQRIVCTKCGNTFASRCSLRRHISWNRCKGLRVTLPTRTYHCSHCNSDFPNAISLLFHQRSGACKPAIKPVRCPVCLRWFTTMEGLQKHLLAHKHSETFRCDVCQGTYLSLKSLKNHRRRIHRIMAGETNPNSKEQVVHGSVSL